MESNGATKFGSGDWSGARDPRPQAHALRMTRRRLAARDQGLIEWSQTASRVGRGFRESCAPLSVGWL